MMNGLAMGFMWIWPLLLLVGVVTLVWGLVRASTPTGTGTSTGRGRAREILEECFARGEITEQELRERMRVLDDH
jgi:putative membrane protein